MPPSPPAPTNRVTSITGPVTSAGEPIPVRVRVVWPDGSVERLDGAARGWTREAVCCRVTSAQGYSWVGWWAAGDVERVEG